MKIYVLKREMGYYRYTALLSAHKNKEEAEAFCELANKEAKEFEEYVEECDSVINYLTAIKSYCFTVDKTLAKLKYFDELPLVYKVDELALS